MVSHVSSAPARLNRLAFWIYAWLLGTATQCSRQEAEVSQLHTIFGDVAQTAINSNFLFVDSAFPVDANSGSGTR